MDTLPLEIIEKIFLYVPTKQIPINMVYINKQITKIIMSKNFWINKSKYINPKVWVALREFNDKEVRYLLWFCSHIKEEFFLPRYNPSHLYEIQILEDDDKMMIMAHAGFLIGRNIDKYPLSIRLTFNIKNIYELYIFLKIVAAMEIPLIYHTLKCQSKYYPVKVVWTTKYNVIYNIKLLRTNLKIIGDMSFRHLQLM